MISEECPNHEGNFDCTPFCPVCEGAQETLPCQTCGTPVPADVHKEELGFCILCQHEYFDNDKEN